MVVPHTVGARAAGGVGAAGRTLSGMSRAAIPGGLGTVHPVRVVGDPVLRSPGAEVTRFGPDLARLVEDLYASMYAARGVGLAAHQIGVGLRVFVYDCPDDEDRRHRGHLVNPRVVAVDGPVVRGPEGCLSLPRREFATPRWDRAVVEGVDLAGAPVRVTGTGFFARCLQHECDHLDGGLYVDHLTGVRALRARRAVRRASRRVAPGS